jgi:glutaredoxin-related protein
MSHTINLNEIEYLQVKLSSTMNNVKKPIKLHKKKKSLDKYS